MPRHENMHNMLNAEQMKRLLDEPKSEIKSWSELVGQNKTRLKKVVNREKLQLCNISFVSFLLLCVGFIRLYVYGTCPECNFDGKHWDECTTCERCKYLPRLKSKRTKRNNRVVWERYKRVLANKN